LSAGTGAAFALLPAQNATGNWIKVVQRVPVRVALDAKQLAANPLRVGLSMDATVDVTDKNGKTLADASQAATVAQTQVYSALDAGADAEVRRIIAANTGRGVAARTNVAKGATSSQAVEKPASPVTQTASAATNNRLAEPSH
jgi:membrane fusion protein (multidrug efflux system)